MHWALWVLIVLMIVTLIGILIYIFMKTTTPKDDHTTLAIQQQRQQQQQDFGVRSDTVCVKSAYAATYNNDGTYVIVINTTSALPPGTYVDFSILDQDNNLIESNKAAGFVPINSQVAGQQTFASWTITGSNRLKLGKSYQLALDSLTCGTNQDSNNWKFQYKIMNR